MPTTIQVKEETLELLKQLRAQEKADSYDETIQRLVKKAKSKAGSMYGYLGHKDMKDIMRGLRDKEDRF